MTKNDRPSPLEILRAARDRLEQTELPHAQLAVSQAECELGDVTLAFEAMDAPQVREATDALNNARAVEGATIAKLEAVRRELVREEQRLREADLERAFREDFGRPALAAVALALRLEVAARELGQTYRLLVGELTRAHANFPADRGLGTVTDFSNEHTLSRQRLWFNLLEALWWASGGTTRQAHPLWNREIAESGHGPTAMKIAAETVSAFPGLVERHGGPADLAAALRAALAGEPAGAPSASKGKKSARAEAKEHNADVE